MVKILVYTKHLYIKCYIIATNGLCANVYKFVLQNVTHKSICQNIEFTITF